MTRRRAVALVVGAVAVIAALVALLGPSGSRGGSTANGKTAPLFETFDLQGRPVSLADFRGHRVVLNFWASWCQPCREEFPLLRQLVAGHPDVRVLGVVFQDSDAPARAFLQAEQATWPGLVDPKGQIAGAYGVHAKPGIPVSVLIGPDGVIRGRQVGPLVDSAAAEAFIRVPSGSPG